MSRRFVYVSSRLERGAYGFYTEIDHHFALIRGYQNTDESDANVIAVQSRSMVDIKCSFAVVGAWSTTLQLCDCQG